MKIINSRINSEYFWFTIFSLNTGEILIFILLSRNHNNKDFSDLKEYALPAFHYTVDIVQNINEQFSLISLICQNNICIELTIQTFYDIVLHFKILFDTHILFCKLENNFLSNKENEKR